MIITGIKFVCERTDGEITTWHDTLSGKIEDVVNKIKHQKGWIGGEFQEVRIEFDVNGEYYKIYLNIEKCKLNDLLKT